MPIGFPFGAGGASGVSSVNAQTGAITFQSSGATIVFTNPSPGVINAETGASAGVASLQGLTGGLTFANANGFSITASGTTLTIVPGNITPLSVVATNGVSGSGAAFTSLSANGIVKASGAAGTLGIASAGDFPMLNQNTTGNAATATALATGRTISVTGDLAYTSPSFDGSGNVTAAGTLATVNTNVGSFGSSTSIPNFTVNGKGLITAAGGNVVIAPAGTLSGTTLNSTVVTSSLTSVGAQAQALNMNTHQINAVVDPTSAQDAATKNYVDLAVATTDAKTECQAATTTALAAATYNNGSSGVGATLTLTVAAVLILDGYTPALGDRLLIKNQASAFQNGIYTLTTVGTVVVNAVLTRATDFDQPNEIDGALVYILNGATNGNTLWFCTTTGTVTIGTTNINWSQFLGATYAADGTTLTLTGSTFSVNSTFQATLATLTGSQTLTNKRITRRFITTTQSATPTINTDNTDISSITALAQAITSMTTNLSGTPNAGDLLQIQITDNGTARAITWGAKFASTTVTLPTTTVISTLLRVGFQWDTVAAVWQCIATC